jgi:predicted hexulose-6-phosphate isomerase
VYRLGIYEKALKAKPLCEMFEDAAVAGYDNFEISLDETDARLTRLNWTQGQLSEIEVAARNSGIQLFSACFSGLRRFPLGSADKTVEKQAMQMMSKGIDFCSNLGVRVLQLSGFDVFYEPHSTETSKRYIDNLLISTQLAARAGVMLAIEPVEGHITSIREAMIIVNKIHSPWLQVYPDVANLVAMGFDPISELALGEGHMVGLHIRDAHVGTSYNIPWGSGTMDFLGVFSQLQKMNFNSPIVIELWHEQDDDALESARTSREYILNKIKEASLKPSQEM